MAYREDMMTPGREEQLRHQAFAVNDMLRQLKQATANQPDSNRGRPLRGNRGKRRAGPRNNNQPNPQAWQSSSHSRWDYYTDERPTLKTPSTYGTSTYTTPPEKHQFRNESRYYSDHPMYRTPPVRHRSRNKPKRHDDDHHVTPEELVQCLVNFPNLSASLLQLMESKNLKPSTVRQIVLSNQQLFFLADEEVKLQPKISVCKAFLESEGCLDRSRCKNFHICPKYLTGSCSGKDCFLGHSWLTNHNRSLLECLHIEKLPAEKLQMLFRSLGSDVVKPESLSVCSQYNKNICDAEDCQALHVCLSFVLGGMKCKVKNCKLNHNILNESCCQLLDMHGFSTNEAPRDVTLALLAANPSIKSKENSTNEAPQNTDNNDDSSNETRDKASKEEDLEDAKIDKVNTVGTSSSDDSEVSSDDELVLPESSNNISDSFDSESDCDLIAIEKETPRKMSKSKARDKRMKKVSLMKLPESNDSNSESDIAIHTDDKKKIPLTKRKSQAKDKRKQNEVELIQKVKDDNYLASSVDEEKVKESPPKIDHRRTLWSHYIQGNVPVDEICYDSVESLCKYEATGCKRLHATQHFHWQVREPGKHWLNLRLAQLMCLERAFCDVAEDGVDLPRLDPSTIENSVSGLLIVMGRDTWHADFKTMSLTNSGDTKKLQIRRLYSNPPTGQEVKAALYLWYFLDKNSKWVKYGNVDTVGETNLVSSVTSDDIEKHYRANPSSPLSFQNSKFSYILDFKTMTQTNQNTNVSREVRRRPEIHLEEEEKLQEEKKNSDLPEFWDAMQSGERITRVLLSPSSTEYQTVINLLGGRLPSSSVTQIERIQNPFLWRALQNKITEMTTIYGDETQVNVRQLFHGTRHDVVSNICGENFDWRLHGSASGQMFGHGTYFSTDPAYSYNYSPADPAGKRFMFIARVAVGSVIVGNSSMVRPPINPITSAPYDSTVNNASNFSIIVKYDKQEYYPEYILTLT